MSCTVGGLREALVPSSGIWSACLPAGELFRVVPTRDVILTNVALGPEVQDSGRSTIQLHFTTTSIPKDNDEIGTAVICSLTPGKSEQYQANIVLLESQEYVFEVLGPNDVYLLGNYVGRQETGKTKRDTSKAPTDDDDGQPHPSNPFPLIGGHPYPTIPPNSQVAFPAPKPFCHATDLESLPTACDEQPPSTIGDNVIIKDVTVGGGEKIIAGSYVIVWYICTVLETGFVFDKSTTPDGSATTFIVGGRFVPKDWDEAMVGMRVGGERHITIPPSRVILRDWSKKDFVVGLKPTIHIRCKVLGIRGF